MKSTELRIGNWILGTPTYNKDLLKKFQVYSETFCDIESGHGLFEPIKLTEGILKESGFVCTWSGQGDGTTYQKGKITLHGEEEMHLEAGGKLQWIFTPAINYVHQLQNLYFALTGEELNINF